jgi:hypothetical protein
MNTGSVFKILTKNPQNKKTYQAGVVGLVRLTAQAGVGRQVGAFRILPTVGTLLQIFYNATTTFGSIYDKVNHQTG